MSVEVVLVPRNCFYWGAAAPQTPCCSWGASSPPDPLAGGLQPPVPPCISLHTERLRLSGSPFFLVPRSWYQNLGSGSWYQVACRVPNVACHAVSIPFVSKSSVSCRVINLRVGVSVPCRGHPAMYPLVECNTTLSVALQTSSQKYYLTHI